MLHLGVVVAIDATGSDRDQKELANRTRSTLGNPWAEPFGDRRQEIVFIGAGIDWPSLKSGLDACLLGHEAGDDLTAFANLPDPFPQWRHREQAA